MLRTSAIVTMVCALASAASAAITINGSDVDKKAFDTMLDECSKHSPSFAKALKDWRDDKAHAITLTIGRTGRFIDASGPGSSTINLDNLDVLPEPTIVDGKAKMPDGVPPWATSRTEILMHVLKEAFETLGVALTPGSHQQGIGWQNRVRDDFHQGHHVQTQSIDGNGADVEMDMYSETFRFVDDKLVIKYYKGRKHERELKYENGHWSVEDHGKWKATTFVLGPEIGGPTFYASFGGSIPFGDLAGGESESSEYSIALPVEVAGGYTLPDGIFAGAYLAFAPAFVPGSSCVGASCSGYDLRFGVEAQRHFTIYDGEPLVPWAGVGIGYELSHTSFAMTGMPASTDTVRGLDVSAAVGADYPLGGTTSIGPFIRLDVGEYGHASGTTNNVDFSADIMQTAVHEWLTIGVRGAYQL